MGFDRLKTLRTHGHRVHFGTASRVDHLKRRLRISAQPAVPELHQRKHDLEQVLATFGKKVLSARLTLFFPNDKDFVLDQRIQPIRQRLSRDTEALLKSIEPANTEKCFPDDQKRPTVDHKLYGAADRAISLEFARP
nr:hypothetical protein [Roseovarius pacificus]